MMSPILRPSATRPTHGSHRRSMIRHLPQPPLHATPRCRRRSSAMPPPDGLHKHHHHGRILDSRRRWRGGGRARGGASRLAAAVTIRAPVLAEMAWRRKKIALTVRRALAPVSPAPAPASTRVSILHYEGKIIFRVGTVLVAKLAQSSYGANHQHHALLQRSVAATKANT